jgi:hypothetical protein
MVNRKSKSANFIQNGSIRKNLLEKNFKTNKKSKIKFTEKEYYDLINNRTSINVLDNKQNTDTYNQITFEGAKYIDLKKFNIKMIKKILEIDVLDLEKNITKEEWELISYYIHGKLKIIEKDIKFKNHKKDFKK